MADGPILILDDDDGVALLERRRLERAGYRVITAGTVEEALVHVQEHPFALVLLDYRLAGESDGLAFHEQLKALGHQLPVILVTGHSDEATAIRALRAGVRDFVTKSAHYLDYLPEAVSRVLAQVRTERQLAESQARLTSLIDAAQDAFIVAEADGEISLFNRAAERAFGCSARDVIGRYVGDFCELQRDQASEGYTLRDEGRRPDGTRFPIEGTVSRVQLPGREFLTIILRDVSARRDAEEQHRRLEEQLRHAQRMEAMGRLAGGVAHDFNNLLTVISGCSELILQAMPLGDPLRGPVTTMRDTGQRATALTSQLLAFSHAQVVDPERLDLNGVVDDFARMLRRLIGDHIELVLLLAPTPCPVLADPRQIEQVVMNLVVNARDAMPSGGTLVIETSDARLGDGGSPTPFHLPDGLYVRLAVSDTGTGMPEDVRSRIFEPFFTTKQVGKGTGLGLSTVYGIVRQCGGHIEVDSEVGHGSTFTVYLPWAGHEQAGTAAAEPALTYPSGTARVLVVEDEPAVRDLIVHVFSSHGYQVTAAEHGAAAVAHVEGGAPVDLVVTDVMMPGLSGPAVVEAISRLRPDVRVLYLSGHTEDPSVHPGGRPAHVGFLQKPFSFSALLTKAREVLAGPAGG